ncbi:unnamed protein product [Oikopleura dioica]|uniref:SUEL-type lectin domain-containing protein n=1 Tax=Oikopleura dioica TaxID=34765 RepID=E4X7S9_OIKDI|nr:unnamed protein product [Oikopleura dioica]
MTPVQFLGDIWCIAFAVAILLLAAHTEGGVLSTKPDRSDQLELLEFHKEAFCGQQQIRDGLESYISNILRNKQQGVAPVVFQLLTSGDEQLCLDGLTIVIQKATFREIFGLTEFTAGAENLCASQETEKKDQTFPAVGHISDKVTKRRVSITSFAPITTTRKTTTAAPTAKPVTTSTTTRSRNYYKVAIKDFRAKMQRNIKPNLKAGKKTFTASARSSFFPPISKAVNSESEPLLGYHVTMCADFASASAGTNEQTRSFQAGLKCPDGKLIHIETAHYGRNNSVTCSRGKNEANEEWFRPCVERAFLDVTQSLRESCEKKSECPFSPVFPVFCPGVAKYTEIRYNCNFNSFQ